MTTENTLDKLVSNAQQKVDLTLFYDGACPICTKEVSWLKRHNEQHKVMFQDISAAGFKPEVLKLSHAQLMAEIHAQKATGEVIKDMPVFRELYTAVGLGWLLAPTAWPILKPLFDSLYQIFARKRRKLGALFLSQIACNRCIK